MRVCEVSAKKKEFFIVNNEGFDSEGEIMSHESNSSQERNKRFLIIKKICLRLISDAKADNSFSPEDEEDTKSNHDYSYKEAHPLAFALLPCRNPFNAESEID